MKPWAYLAVAGEPRQTLERERRRKPMNSAADIWERVLSLMQQTMTETTIHVVFRRGTHRPG